MSDAPSETNAPQAPPDETNEATTAEPAVARDPASSTDSASAPSTDDATPDALFEALWRRVDEAWDDDKPHVAILEHAIRSELLPELAGRYRSQKEVAGREERAKKKLDGIVIAATHMLMATKSEPPKKAPWQLTASVAIVCVVVLVWLAFKIVRP